MSVNTRGLTREANSISETIKIVSETVHQTDRDQLAFDIPGLSINLQDSLRSEDQLALDLTHLISDPLRYSPKIKEILPQKLHSYDLSQLLLFGSPRQAKTGYMMSQCAHRIIDLSSKVNTTYCRSRWCDICAVKKIKKINARLEEALNSTYFKRPSTWCCVTLSLPTCPPSEIRSRVQELNKAYNRLIRYKAIDNICEGTIKSIEVTECIGESGESLANVHIHAILAFNSAYKRDCYVSKKKLLRLWVKATKVKDASEAYAWKQDIKHKDNEKPLIAVLNDASYNNKGMTERKKNGKLTRVTYSNPFFLTLEEQLHCVRLTAFTGSIRDALKTQKEIYEKCKEAQTEYLKMNPALDPTPYSPHSSVANRYASHQHYVFCSESRYYQPIKDNVTLTQSIIRDLPINRRVYRLRPIVSHPDMFLSTNNN